MTDSAEQKTNPEVSIIIPALNEGESLPELYDRVTAEMKRLGVTYEFIVVDDGSTDDTNVILNELMKKDPAVGYVRHFRRHGKSLALMHGFDFARGDIAVTMDGDLQDEPENIGLLLAKIKNEGFHLAGSRRINRMDKASKKMVSWVFNRLVSKLFDINVTDVNSGMKAYSKELYKRIELRGDLHRLTPVLAANHGFTICEVPVTHSPRMKGKSKYMLMRWRGMLDIFSLTALQSTQLRPFHIFGGLGFLSFFLAAAMAVIYAFTCFARPMSRLDLLLLVSGSTFFIMGGVLIMLGLLAEMLLAPAQNREWRNLMIKELRLPDGGKSEHSRSGDEK